MIIIHGMNTEEYGKRAIGGLLLYTGAETIWLSEGVLAAPWWRVV
jgi:hypothetical protein